MSRYLINNYPEYYTYYKDTDFTWDRTGGDPISQGNRNTLLTKDIGVDGIKTGYLTVEGYSLASSMKAGSRRINAVASGFKTKRARTNLSTKLLSYGIRSFDTLQIAKKNEAFHSIGVWQGKNNKVNIVTKENVYVTIPKRKKKTVKAEIEYNGPIQAPISKGDKLGVLNVYIEGKLNNTIDFYSGEDIKIVNIFSRLLHSFNFLVWGDV